MVTRNSEVLADFVSYCVDHPDERFWQALLNWSELPFILASDSPSSGGNTTDTFYWENKNT